MVLSCNWIPMNQKALDRICEVLDSYFPTPPVPLNHTCEFTFLVAIILSAQTTDGKVNQVTAELFRHAPTPQAMAKLSFSFVQKIIQVNFYGSCMRPWCQ